MVSVKFNQFMYFGCELSVKFIQSACKLVVLRL